MDNYKLEKKDVTYEHEVDGMDANKKALSRTVSAEPNASLPEAIDEVGNPGRLAIQYNVGKKPETKSLQNLK